MSWCIPSGKPRASQYYDGTSSRTAIQLLVIVSAFKIFWFTSHFSPALALKTVFAWCTRPVPLCVLEILCGKSQKSDDTSCMASSLATTERSLCWLTVKTQQSSEMITLCLWWFGKLIAKSCATSFSIVPWRESIWLKQQEVHYFSCLFWLSKHGTCVYLFFVYSLFDLTGADSYNRMTLVSSSITMQLYFYFLFILKYPELQPMKQLAAKYTMQIALFH